MKHTYLVSWYAESASRMRQLVGHDVFTLKHKLRAIDIPTVQTEIRTHASVNLHGDPIILSINELAHEGWWMQWHK